MNEYLEKLLRQRAALDKAIAEEEARQKQPVIGSLDWAIEMMEKGLKVCNPQLAKEKAAQLRYYNDKNFNTYWYLVNDTVVEGDGNYGSLHILSWISAASPNGWQIYEPKPEYNVGDWVEVRRSLGISHVMIEKIYNNRIYSRRGIDDHFDNIIRKLKPSEVVLDFGSGIKGTIHSYSGNPEYWFGMKWEGWEYILPIEPLTEPMKTIVLELLKAQEEECGN